MDASKKFSEGLDCFCMQRMVGFNNWRLFGGQ